MRKTDNIYLDALKYGIDNMATGISLDELTNHLNKLGWSVDPNFQPYFHYWFYTQFYHGNVYTTIKNGNHSQAQTVLNEVKHYSSVKCPMTAEAFETYQDFQKLKQLKEDTKKAQKLANLAIWISGGLAFIQIILQLISMYK